MKETWKVYKKNDKTIISEEFPSIYTMLERLKSRPNNKGMKGNDSSRRVENSGSWQGTKTYEEAEVLITEGYTEILDKIKLGINKASKNVLKDSPKSRVIASVDGSTPNIPNYLLGLPNTMNKRQMCPQKIKTIRIIYCPDSNAGTEGSSFIEAGIAMLSAIRIIEKSGIFIKLDVSVYLGCAGNTTCVGMVKMKDYKDRLDIQKLCFPVANPAFLRRFGFKFIETIPPLDTDAFSGGYGRCPDYDTFVKTLDPPKNTVILTLGLIKNDLQNNPEKIIEFINKKIYE